VIIVDMH
jgi:hypothetical protein